MEKNRASQARPEDLQHVEKTPAAGCLYAEAADLYHKALRGMDNLPRKMRENKVCYDIMKGVLAHFKAIIDAVGRPEMSTLVGDLSQHGKVEALRKAAIDCAQDYCTDCNTWELFDDPIYELADIFAEKRGVAEYLVPRAPH
jgi:hypothetical protein